MEDEKDVLEWMIGQKEDESIDEIDRDTLNEYITSKDFLAVVFCKCTMRVPTTLIDIICFTKCLIMDALRRYRR